MSGPGSSRHVCFTWASDIPMRSWDQSMWGRWRINRGTRVLELLDENGNLCHEVDLDRCLDSASVLDWICQDRKKTWATDEVLAGPVHALDTTCYTRKQTYAPPLVRAVTPGSGLRRPTSLDSSEVRGERADQRSTCPRQRGAARCAAFAQVCRDAWRDYADGEWWALEFRVAGIGFGKQRVVHMHRLTTSASTWRPESSTNTCTPVSEGAVVSTLSIDDDPRRRHELNRLRRPEPSPPRMVDEAEVSPPARPVDHAFWAPYTNGRWWRLEFAPAGRGGLSTQELVYATVQREARQRDTT